ncbi:hypothetical protein FA09DRAFT_340267 [Tilletiopsis washingtonensis]|uniref:t-SNARE coiled-coil homology domain-containing protein n=1 Tax=Tilletiopsis washingtonensis TaxID=58919 RepID=A0A316Z4F2_9BASI|nr:hypothetical protein FA09DRAFT_340267 [Tilletiopsis washingtonensis]PWN96469.1 hypothetical protein FA09DRAFT_340267 [Tilletiopsis washingtonensis]
MSRSAAQTYESQNDDQLGKLLDKVKALRGVTNDIHDDAESQRTGLLADASESFDAFSDRLSHTSTRFTRSVVNGARGHRTTLYIVAGVVGLFLFWHFFF